ncbi:alpha-amylase family glycosyl hydrolase [Massilibacteroides sp.]|uniref:alpha-amylase family glycosyl hydrolase n=1 Tax=Massilibacteroides sp. TaxID=2034766 RepID=UPI002634A392|nr:alpha-amylase family glycosyl hydrolase [Massilibacteroides sp.]MDD4514443.1 alpha-amylase family glycosyl hydrolase [Massilibacteroides sp.]
MKKNEKIVIYQVFPRLFGNLNESLKKDGSIQENGVGKFSTFTANILKQIKELGTTHIWYTGVIEHATETDYSAYGIRPDHSATVKGKAGSPYAIKDYYDVDPDLADNVRKRMKEFEHLVERTHDAGLNVIIDFVPNHVSRQYHSDCLPPFIEDLGQHDNTTRAFDRNNNFYYFPGSTLVLHYDSEKQIEDFEYSEFPAKVTGNDCFSTTPGKNDWYETVKLNYGIDYLNGGQRVFDPIPSTWKKMLEILLYWADKGVDGFRCDMAEMVPVEFWNWAIPQVKAHADVCFIAEVYNPAEYRNYIFNGKFDYLYDKVGLYDTLRGIVCGHTPASSISDCWKSVEGIQKNMLNFMENHDEQRIASDFFAGNAIAGIPTMIVATLMNTNPVMIYNGQELGERGMDEEGFSGRDGRTSIFDYWSMSTVRNWLNNTSTAEEQALRDFYSKLLNIAKEEKSVFSGDFHDLVYANENNPDFNLYHQYAFLRKFENEVLLVVVNFDRSPKTVRVNIPQQAFDGLGIGDNLPAKVKDLFTGKETIGTLTSACPYQLEMEPFSGKVLKFMYL